MNQTLKKSAQSVQDILGDMGLDFQVVELSQSTRTAQEAADSIGCEVAQIAKSLIFMTKTTQRPVLVLASGVNRVNEKAIAKLIGEKISKADANQTREITGFAIGGIPPVGHQQDIELIFVDEDLLTYESLWAAAGTPNAVFNLKGEDLLTMTKGKVVSVK